MDINKMTYWELIDYLKENFYTTDFIGDHTRKQFVTILSKLIPHNKWKTGMCKSRQFTHVEYFLKLHSIGCRMCQKEYNYRTMSPYQFASKYYG